MSNYRKTQITYRASFWGAIVLAVTVAALGGLPSWISFPVSSICLVLSVAGAWYAVREAMFGDRDSAAFAGGLTLTLACLSAPWCLSLVGCLAEFATPSPWWLSVLQLAAGTVVLLLLRGNGDDPVTPLSGCSSTKVPPSGKWFDGGILSIVLSAATFSGLAAGSALASLGPTLLRLKTFL